MCRGKNSQRLTEDEQMIQSAVKNAVTAAKPTLLVLKQPEMRVNSAENLELKTEQSKTELY